MARRNKQINKGFCDVSGVWKSDNHSIRGKHSGRKKRQHTGLLPWYMTPILPETLTKYGLLERLRAMCTQSGLQLNEEKVWNQAYACQETEGEVCAGIGYGKTDHNGNTITSEPGDWYEWMGSGETIFSHGPRACRNSRDMV